MLRLVPLLGCVALIGCGDALDTSLAGTEDVGSASQAGALWFTPNVGSTDMLRLFAEPDTWARSRRDLSVMQLYSQQLWAESAGECPSCGENILPGFERAGAFARLKEWGVELAVETGAVKHHTCDGENAGRALSAVIAKVEARGGSVRYVAMDEPYIGGEDVINGESCRYDRARSALETARFVRWVERHHPGVAVGDIEPYPYFRVDRLKAWIDELARNGIRPAFFHLDIDRNAVKNVRADVKADLRAMKSFLTARGIPMGVIFWGHELDIPRNAANPDRAYYEAVMGWVRTVQQAIGAPDQAIFQSWLRSPDGRNVVPNNLPEDGYGHTRLLRDGWALLRPATPQNDEATIKVRHGYQGILGRPADEGGLQGYAQAVRNGLTMVDFCRSLFDSAEFRENRSGLSPEQLADALYQGILQRQADPSGFSATVAEIRAGRRAQRAAAMLDSAEFRERFLR